MATFSMHGWAMGRPTLDLICKNETSDSAAVWLMNGAVIDWIGLYSLLAFPLTGRFYPKKMVATCSLDL